MGTPPGAGPVWTAPGCGGCSPRCSASSPSIAPALSTRSSSRPRPSGPKAASPRPGAWPKSCACSAPSGRPDRSPIPLSRRKFPRKNRIVSPRPLRYSGYRTLFTRRSSRPLRLSAPGGFGMTHYAISPIDDAISRQVRTTLTDPIYGLEVPVSVAGPGNYGPCRSCLHTFTIGERRILFLYNPFSPEQHADFAGPVFIHDGDCESYSQRAVFPPAIRSLPIVLKGYGADNRFIAEETPPGPDVE